MKTPIYDFVKDYAASGPLRFHMPGHKGIPLLGPEPMDLTEVRGADALYEAEGIIAQSEANASALFGSGATFYSTEGSSLCIRAMLQLLMQHRPEKSGRRILAARNVHKSFVYAAALLGVTVEWLYPEGDSSLCSCPISAESIRLILSKKKEANEPLPAAVFLTSPDYLGGIQDVAGIASVVHSFGVRLAVDNAHGAYLHFLPTPVHPLDLGADLCCDSAHKTLPALTGSAYLHLGKSCPPEMRKAAKAALSLFGSTSPSYLILSSLDKVNAYLNDGYLESLSRTIEAIDAAKKELAASGWTVLPSDPLRITLKTDGVLAAKRLRDSGAEPEYVDPTHLVLMLTPETGLDTIARIPSLLGMCDFPTPDLATDVLCGEKALSLRDALLSPAALVPVEKSLGRICADPTVSCPPAIPIVLPGERIRKEHIERFRLFGIESVSVTE